MNRAMICHCLVMSMRYTGEEGLGRFAAALVAITSA
jgi:hypothetical protein